MISRAGVFSSFLGKSIRQDDQSPLIPKTEQAEGIVSQIGPDLPNVLSSFEFLKYCLGIVGSSLTNRRTQATF